MTTDWKASAAEAWKVWDVEYRSEQERALTERVIGFFSRQMGVSVQPAEMAFVKLDDVHPIGAQLDEVFLTFGGDLGLCVARKCSGCLKWQYQEVSDQRSLGGALLDEGSWSPCECNRESNEETLVRLLCAIIQERTASQEDY